MFLFTGKKKLLEGKTLGIDVNHWQGEFDFNKAKEKGVKFVIGRINEYSGADNGLFFDIRARENREKLKDTELAVGGYSPLSPIHDAEKQASFYLDWYTRNEVQFPPIVSFEDCAYQESAEYMWKLLRWLEMAEKETGRKPIINTSENFLANFDRRKTMWMSRYPLWINCVRKTNNPTLPKEWDKYTLWRYSDNGSYPRHKASKTGFGTEWGSSSPQLNMNFFNGTDDELLAFCNLAPTNSKFPRIELFRIKILEETIDVKSGPCSNYGRIGHVSAGDEYSVYDVSVTGWYRISRRENRWIPPSLGKYRLVEHVTHSPYFKFEAVCRASSVPKRGAPTKRAEILGHISSGEAVCVYENSDGWWRINPIQNVWVEGSVENFIAPTEEEDYVL